MAELKVRNFGKMREKVEIPDPVVVQRKGYGEFLQMDAAPTKRANRGLEELFRETFPIESYDKGIILEYLYYELEQPRYNINECRQLRLTYGYPLKITELIAHLPGVYYVTRQAVHTPNHVRKTKKAISKAFEIQKEKKGITFIEVVSNCNSGWKMTPVQSNKWMEENMFPFFPLGGFTPMQSTALSKIAVELGATPMQVALAWLMRRAPNILLIPGTSSIGHLRENLAATALQLPGEAMSVLHQIAGEFAPAGRSSAH